MEISQLGKVVGDTIANLQGKLMCAEKDRNDAQSHCSQLAGENSRLHRVVSGKNRQIGSLRDELGKVQAALLAEQSKVVTFGQAELKVNSWYASAEAEVTPEPVHYKVQYHTYSGWWGAGLPRPTRFVSRNAAYRWMRARSEAVGLRYRVVPTSVPDGEDKSPRGHYRIQVWAVFYKEWVDVPNIRNYFDTSKEASSAIEKRGRPGMSLYPEINTYRVKWFPGNRPPPCAS